jgi:hypothetical protein
MSGSIPQRERSTQKPDQCRRARTPGSGCPQPELAVIVRGVPAVTCALRRPHRHLLRRPCRGQAVQPGAVGADQSRHDEHLRVRVSKARVLMIWQVGLPASAVSDLRRSERMTGNRRSEQGRLLMLGWLGVCAHTTFPPMSCGKCQPQFQRTSGNGVGVTWPGAGLPARRVRRRWR